MFKLNDITEPPYLHHMYIVAHKIHERTKANNIETKTKHKNLNWSEVNQLAINIYFLNTSTAEYTVIY